MLGGILGPGSREDSGQSRSFVCHSEGAAPEESRPTVEATERLLEMQGDPSGLFGPSASEKTMKAGSVAMGRTLGAGRPSGIPRLSPRNDKAGSQPGGIDSGRGHSRDSEGESPRNRPWGLVSLTPRMNPRATVEGRTPLLATPLPSSFESLRTSGFLRRAPGSFGAMTREAG